MLGELIGRERSGRPIRVAVVGAGDYGRSLVDQLRVVPGVVAALVCDVDIARARHAFVESGVGASTIVEVGEENPQPSGWQIGRPVVTRSLRVAVEAPIDVVVECTGNPESGARVADAAIRGGRHVVMVNVEADVTVGAELAERARRAAVVYTLADGDQPSLIVGLAEWAECLGFQVEAAGKWTSVYPYEVAARRLAAMESPTPSDVTYLDGSKTQIECAATANCLGLSVDTPGMHGWALDLDDIPTVMRGRERGGRFESGRCVDFVNCATDGVALSGAHPGGVFAVVGSEARRALEVMGHKGVKLSRDGTHAVLYRPYHLVGAETPWSIALAAVTGSASAVPRPDRSVEVVAVSKTALDNGDVLAGLGHADIRGVAVRADEARAQRLLPVGLAAGSTMRVDCGAGHRLRYDDVGPPRGSILWDLRATPDLR